MRVNFSASVNTTTRLCSGCGGNPKLEPWRANSDYVSLEKYFSKGIYFAVAGFVKDLTSGIYVKTIPFDFTGFTNPTSVTPVSLSLIHI